MQIESVDVRPRPRHFRTRVSYVGAVFPLLLEGKSRQEIATETGLTGDTLTYAIRDNYHRYVERPDAQTQKRTHRENTSAAKGGILLIVSRYFPLDSTSRQTQVALEVDHGIIIEDHKRITNAYSRERHRHGLQRPIAELMVEAQRDKRRSQEELFDIVRRRQAAYRLIVASGLEKPKTLQQWRELEENPLTEEEKNRLGELLLNPIFVPHDPFAQRYLLNLANGSPHLNERIEMIAPTLNKSLQLKADLIRRQVKRRS